MEKNKYEKEYKHVLSLIKERNHLLDLKYQIKSIKLDKPIHHGYVRFLKVRNEYLQKKGLVDAFNFCGQRKAYSKTRDFIVKRGKNQHEKHAHMLTAMDPRFRLFRSQQHQEEEIAKIEQHQKYLRLHQNQIICNCHNNACGDPKKFLSHYSFDLPWTLEEITEDHYLTHYKPVDSELESKLKRISNEIDSHQYYRWVSRRNTWDKIDKERYYSTIKYAKDRIYHSEDENFTDS